MPNLPISQLPSLSAITADAEFAVAQNGTTYRVKSGYTSSGKLFGSFYQETTQSGFTQDTIYALSASSVADSVGISVVNDSQFTVASGGTFNLQFSAQLQKLQGGSQETITIWIRINGIDVPWSSTNISFANNNVLSVASWNFVVILNAEDNVQLMLSTTDSEIILYGQPETTGPVRPGIPSLIITMLQI